MQIGFPSFSLEDYSFICRLPNFHRLPGPRMGGNRPQVLRKNIYRLGRIFSGIWFRKCKWRKHWSVWKLRIRTWSSPWIRGIPKIKDHLLIHKSHFQVNAGWGVDVGPIPGMTQGVGVNTGEETVELTSLTIDNCRNWIGFDGSESA